MAAVVFVHGVGQQVKGAGMVHAEVSPALADGVRLAGGEVHATDVACTFYGDLFRPAGEYLAPEPLIDVQDLTEAEVNLLVAWWQRAADTDSTILPPDTEVLARMPQPAVAAVRALGRSRFFAGIGERLLLGSLRQVRRYLHEPDLRKAIRQRVLDAMTPRTRVMIGHSLGSVVAYEALAMADRSVALITLGSPLGMPRLVFDRLEPAPPGCWPGRVTEWTNVVDTGDIVAAVADLRPLFGERLVQVQVHNGARAHDARPYLTERLTGRAVLRGLRG